MTLWLVGGGGWGAGGLRVRLCPPAVGFGALTNSGFIIGASARAGLSFFCNIGPSVWLLLFFCLLLTPESIPPPPTNSLGWLGLKPC